jgi:hypothetical protein
MTKTLFLLLTFIIVFNAQNVLAQDTSFETIERLMEIRRKGQKKKFNSEFDRVQRNSKQHSEVKLKDITGSKIILIALSKGTKIINFQSNDDILLRKNMVVNIYEVSDEFGYFYIKSKKNELKYKVHREDIHKLDRVTKMVDDPDTFTPEKPKKKHQYYDRNFYLTHQFSFDVAYTASESVQALLNERDALFGESTSYSYSLYSNWNYPFQSGLTCMWENTLFKRGAYTDLIRRSFQLGAIIKSEDIWWRKRRFQFSLKVMTSLYSAFNATYTGGDDRYDLSMTTFYIGVEHLWKNRIGDFVIGMALKRQWIDLEDPSQSANQTDVNGVDTSVGIYFAQGFNTKW